MAHEVIMPALGMAQDSGRIVAWLKAAGEAVEDGESLFEVETDKAVMEVPAPATGYLSAVTVKENEEAAVGSVIAQIVADEALVVLDAPVSSDTGSETIATPKPDETVVAEPKVAAQTAAAPPSEPEPVPNPQHGAFSPRQQPPVGSGRILASPKARRLAEEQGLDLSQLRVMGVQEPFHADDLVRLASAGSAAAHLTALADGRALDRLLDQASTSPNPQRLYAAFASGAWRLSIDQAEPCVLAQSTDGSVQTLGDESRSPDFVILDLTNTRVTSLVSGSALPFLSVGRQGDTLLLSLTFPETLLPVASAIAWLNELAARLEDPIRQLV